MSWHCHYFEREAFLACLIVSVSLNPLESFSTYCRYTSPIINIITDWTPHPWSLSIFLLLAVAHITGTACAVSFHCSRATLQHACVCFGCISKSLRMSATIIIDKRWCSRMSDVPAVLSIDSRVRAVRWKIAMTLTHEDCLLAVQLTARCSGCLIVFYSHRLHCSVCLTPKLLAHRLVRLLMHAILYLLYADSALSIASSTIADGLQFAEWICSDRRFVGQSEHTAPPSENGLGWFVVAGISVMYYRLSVASLRWCHTYTHSLHFISVQRPDQRVVVQTLRIVSSIIQTLDHDLVEWIRSCHVPLHERRTSR